LARLFIYQSMISQILDFNYSKAWLRFFFDGVTVKTSNKTVITAADILNWYS